jgi:hypothetical protein
MDLFDDPGGLGDHPFDLHNGNLISENEPTCFSDISSGEEENAKKENHQHRNHPQPHQDSLSFHTLLPLSLENKMFRACLRQNTSSKQAFRVSTNDRNKIKTLCITMRKALSVFNPQGGDIRMVSKGAD